jgi:hypothetical protein
MQTIQSQKPIQFSIASLFSDVRLPRRGVSFLVLIAGATILFEVFNFSTTENALGGVMGGLRFLGISWATILALAFCGIDFAGIARLFAPEERANGRLEGIYLLAAWLLAGVINAATTWWAVTVALLQQPLLGNELVSRRDLLLYVPILVAGTVWLIRILLIGTLTMSGGKAGIPRIDAVEKKPLSIRQASPSPIPASAFTGHSPAIPAFLASRGPARRQGSSTARPFTGGRS